MGEGRWVSGVRGYSGSARGFMGELGDGLSGRWVRGGGGGG